MKARLMAVVATLAGGALAWAGGGAWPETKHGNPESGVERIGTEPRGSCAQCHVQHGTVDGQPADGPFPYMLFAPADNGLCGTCHSGPGAHEVYGGIAPYESSSHFQDSGMVWPGPDPEGRPGSDAGECVNCHDAHGERDGQGVIPSLLFGREEDLCLTCHDRSPAADVANQLRAGFAHPVSTVGGRHDAAEGANSSRVGVGNRHAECVDCHNPHRSGRAGDAAAPGASLSLRGVSRVKVTNGPAGTQPVYTWAGPGETSFAAEYEVCFKCHSSWTSQPAGQHDMALLLNPANPSYHPVEAVGRNNGIRAEAFVDGWTWDRLTYCSDCHGSDDPSVAGPHGSRYRFILKGDYAASASGGPMTDTDVCFRCHNWETYANPSGSALAGSRFAGHASHVGTRGQTCYVCHETHGSTVQPALIATGRAPGIVAYTRNSTGGTCTATCHGPQVYGIAYGR